MLSLAAKFREILVRSVILSATKSPEYLLIRACRAMSLIIDYRSICRVRVSVLNIINVGIFLFREWALPRKTYVHPAA